MRLSTISKRAILHPGTPVLLELGARIRGIRCDAGLTQVQVAGPFSAAYVSAIERGRVIPSLAALVLLAGRLGVTPAEILAGVNFLALAGYTVEHDKPDANRQPNDSGADI